MSLFRILPRLRYDILVATHRSSLHVSDRRGLIFERRFVLPRVLVELLFSAHFSHANGAVLCCAALCCAVLNVVAYTGSLQSAKPQAELDGSYTYADGRWRAATPRYI